MAKIRTKAGLITIEYDSKSEAIETEYNGIDKWIFKIIQLKPIAQSTLIPFDLVDEKEERIKTMEHKELEGVTLKNIAEYIKTKPDFGHDIIELQEQFLKRRVTARKEPKLYFAFDRLVKEARTIITKELDVIWGTSPTRKSYGGRNLATIYRKKRTPIEIIDSAMKSAIPASQIEEP